MKRSLVIIGLALLLFICGAFWPGHSTTWIQLDVAPGMTVTHVARQLVDKGLFFSVYPMMVWSKVLRADHKIKLGRYRFKKHRSAFWVLRDLISSRTFKIHFPIPEGFSSWQIAERLEQQMICPKEKFIQVVSSRTLEGFLFPATYDLDIGLEPNEVANIFTRQFDQIWTGEMTQRAKALGWSKRNVVTMASIIEREARDRNELPMISAVYHNRLKKHMRLEADPTVQYALGYWKKRLLFSDINQTQSPYNTYLHTGLPPGPICNPGKDAIQAALWPAESDALYFVAKDDGRHDFSTTFKEHSAKVKMRNIQRRKAK